MLLPIVDLDQRDAVDGEAADGQVRRSTASLGGSVSPGNLVGVDEHQRRAGVDSRAARRGCPFTATSANTRFTPTRVGEGMPGIPIVANPDGRRAVAAAAAATSSHGRERGMAQAS